MRIHEWAKEHGDGMTASEASDFVKEVFQLAETPHPNTNIEPDRVAVLNARMADRRANSGSGEATGGPEKAHEDAETAQPPGQPAEGQPDASGAASSQPGDAPETPPADDLQPWLSCGDCLYTVEVPGVLIGRQYVFGTDKQHAVERYLRAAGARSTKRQAKVVQVPRDINVANAVRHCDAVHNDQGEFGAIEEILLDDE